MYLVAVWCFTEDMQTFFMYKNGMTFTPLTCSLSHTLNMSLLYILNKIKYKRQTGILLENSSKHKRKK